MIFGNFHPKPREFSLNEICQNLTDRVFCVEMSRVNQVDPQITGIHKLIVPYIRGHKGVTASGNGLLHTAGTGTAAHSNLMYRFSTVNITQSFAAQFCLYHR